MPQRQPAGWYHITVPARWLVPHATRPAGWCITTVPATEWPTGWCRITKRSACGHYRLTWSQTAGCPRAMESARWLAHHPEILVTPSHPPRRSSVTALRGAAGPSVYGSLPDIAGSGRQSRPPARTPVSIPLLRRLRRRLGRALLMHGSFGCLGCCDPRLLRRTLRPHYRAPAAAKCSPSRSCRRRRASVHRAYLVITTPGPNGSDVSGRRGPPAGDHRQYLPGSRSSALPLPHHWLATCRGSPPSRVRGHPPLSRGCTACFAVTCPRLPAVSQRMPAHPTAPSVRRVGGLERPPTRATSAGPGLMCGMPDSWPAADQPLLDRTQAQKYLWRLFGVFQYKILSPCP